MTLELLGYTGTTIAAVVEIGNISILSGLLYLYIKSYRQIKIGFTLGLILFTSILLIRSIFTIGLLLISDTDALVSEHGAIPSIIEFISLIILLKITWDY